MNILSFLFSSSLLRAEVNGKPAVHFDGSQNGKNDELAIRHPLEGGKPLFDCGS
jgi:hypothetical protein